MISALWGASLHDGQYGIWKSGSDWVVTYNTTANDGYHDIVVKGADPHGHVAFF